MLRLAVVVAHLLVCNLNFYKVISFQQIILELQNFWAKQGCAILQPVDLEVGAGTLHQATVLKALGEKPWRVAYA